MSGMSLYGVDDHDPTTGPKPTDEQPKEPLRITKVRAPGIGTPDLIEKNVIGIYLNRDLTWFENRRLYDLGVERTPSGTLYTTRINLTSSNALTKLRELAASIESTGELDRLTTVESAKSLQQSADEINSVLGMFD